MERPGLVEALRTGDEKRLREALGRPSSRAESWYELSALPRAEGVGMLAGGGAMVALVLSHHPDGRVREAAVRALARFPDEGLPYLVVRANDWAWPVVRAARAAVRDALPRASDAALARAAPAFLALVRGRRWGNEEPIRDFLDALARRPGLAEKILSSASGPLAVWLLENVRDFAEGEMEAVRRALRHGDPRVQYWAARRSLEVSELRGALHHARSARLRRLALDFAPPEILEEALLDLDAGVRNDARYLLGKRDYAAFYRATLPEMGAISGLGETGSRVNAELLRPLFDHPKAEVQRRALLAAARLAEEAAIPDLVAALRRPSHRVQRAAAEALGRLAFAIDAEEAAGMDLSPAAAWLLMERTPRWAGLIAVLRRADAFPRADAWLARWAERSQTRSVIPPTADEAIDATAALVAARTFLQDSTVEAVRTAIRTWFR